MSENISVQDFQIFKEAMIEENLALQIDIVKKLVSLAKALGEKATREELLPFIENNLYLHDELLLHLSDQLKHFMPLVGGAEHSQIIFDILTKLCNTDENIVREKAVEAVIYAGKDLSPQQIKDFIMPVIYKLVNDDWFTSKCSAVMLFSAFYPKLSKKKKCEIRNTLKTLIQDDSPMVRKAAATACVDFVAVLEDEEMKKEFIPMFGDIAQDPMDSVRSVSIDISLALSKKLQGNDLDESIFKTLQSASDDASWRIRQRLANSIADIQQYIPHGKYRGKLLAIFQKLSQDMEPEVRILAAANLFKYCKNLFDSYRSEPQYDNNFEPVFEQSLLPIIHRLAVDENEDVRMALSSNILSLNSVLSDDSFKKNIMPFLLQVLDNEESMTIQANILLGLSNLSSNIDLTNFLIAIKNSIRAVIVRSHSNWRTRRSVLMSFVDISKFCDADYFSDHFKIYYAALLSDPVFAVRRSASVILPILSKRYGIKWSSEHLVPYFTMFARDTRYLYRYISLFGITEMVKPSLGSNPNSYLKDLKIIIEDKENVYNKKARMALAKAVKICHLVEKELKDSTYVSMLQLKNKLDYSTNMNITIYEETDFSTIKEKYKNINFYSTNEKDLEENNCPYLLGILSLIHNKFLPIIEALNKDVTENIQICAICTLGEIEDFLKKLNKEISEPWVETNMNTLTHEEISSINDEIHHELKTAQLEQEPEEINSHLIKLKADEPDLNKTISFTNSALLEPTDIKENSKENDQDLQLVQEVLDIFDKKLSESSSATNEQSVNEISLSDESLVSNREKTLEEPIAESPPETLK